MRPRTGFTLIEVIVAIIVMVILAAVVTPNMISTLDRARIDKAADALANLAEAIEAFEGDLGRTWPSTLSQLVQPITTSDQDICGGDYRNADVDDWDGPYLNRTLSASGLPVIIGTAQIQLGYVDVGANGHLRIDVPQVSEDDALLLDDAVDGDGDPASGTVQWTVPDAQGLVTVSYVLTIRDC